MGKCACEGHLACWIRQHLHHFLWRPSNSRIVSRSVVTVLLSPAFSGARSIRHSTIQNQPKPLSPGHRLLTFSTCSPIPLLSPSSLPGMPIVHLHPMRRPSGPVRSVPPLRYQSLKPQVAGRTKQVRPNLALLEWRNKDAIRAAGQ